MPEVRVSKSKELMWVSALTIGTMSSYSLLYYIIIRLADVAGFESVAASAGGAFSFYVMALAVAVTGGVAALPNLAAAIALTILSRRRKWAGNPLVWASASLLATIANYDLLRRYGTGEAPLSLAELLTLACCGILIGFAGHYGLRIARSQTRPRNASITAR